MYDLVLEGRILADGRGVDSYICVKDGRIADIKRSTPGKGMMGEHHRSGRALILPGAIDTHVHFRDPGLTHKEDFTTGSISAAFGGVTSVIDMPNTKPPTIDQRSLKEKDLIASSRSVIDYGLNLAILEGSDLVGVDLLLTGGGGTPPPSGLKAFLGESTGSLVFGSIDRLSMWAPLLQRTGCILSLHAEDGGLFERIKDPERVRSVLDKHNWSRPAAAEESAVLKAARALGDQIGQAHFLHISTEKGLEAAKDSGASVEVTPHHLLLDIKWAERNLEEQSMAKVNPPVRTTDDRAALWNGIKDGTVTTLGSDHAPHTADEKSKGLLSPSGMPGVETMVPLLIVEFARRKIGLDRLVELTSRAPATRFGLKERGELKKGFLADMAVIDPSSARKVRGDELHSRCGWSAYEGMEASFPLRVYSRGELIIEDESLAGRPGRGRNLRSG
ncbi:MAG: dihydroorotase [Thermoplasmatota archaeon]